MARPTLVLDASVGVKWFSDIGESHVPQARAILRAHGSGHIDLLVPDLFFHEVANALLHKKALSLELIDDSITTLFDLGLTVFPSSEKFLRTATHLARKAGITEYDACYAVVAIENQCSLVTANSRHQGRVLGCQAIPIEEWK